MSNIRNQDPYKPPVAPDGVKITEQGANPSALGILTAVFLSIFGAIAAFFSTCFGIFVMNTGSEVQDVGMTIILANVLGIAAAIVVVLVVVLVYRSLLAAKRRRFHESRIRRQ